MGGLARLVAAVERYIRWEQGYPHERQEARELLEAALAAAQAEMKPWRVRFVCCGRDDGEQTFATWAEADQARETYSSGAGVAHEGYSSDATAPGHKRVGIIAQAARGAAA